jgi:4-amino-4-deoxy-L-arabinose transferase-like glycosyltransferase
MAACMLVVFVIAVLLRGLWIEHVNLRMAHDGFFYFSSARSLAEGDGYRGPLTGQITANFPPGYSGVLAALFIAFGTKISVAQGFNLVMGGLTAVLVYLIGVRTRGEWAGLTAGLMFAVFPSQVLFAGMIMTETFFTVLMSGLVLMLLYWVRREQPVKVWQAALLGAYMGGMSLVRAESLALLPALIVLWLLLRQRGRILLADCVVLLASATLIITPWTVRNYVQFDELILIRGGHDADTPARMIRLSLSPDFHDEKYLELAEPASFGALRDYYADQPSELLFLAARKVNYYVGSENSLYWAHDTEALAFLSPEFELSPDEATRWSRTADAFYYVVLAIVVLGTPLWWSIRSEHRWILLWVLVSWSAIHLAYAPQERYHFPLIPVMCTLSAVTIVSLAERIARRVSGGDMALGQSA